MCSLGQAANTLERDVYLVTFDEAVTFYVPTETGRFRAVVMPDLDEPFVPVTPQCLGVHTSDPEGKEIFLQLLSKLKAEYSGSVPQQERRCEEFHSNPVVCEMI